MDATHESNPDEPASGKPESITSRL